MLYENKNSTPFFLNEISFITLSQEGLNSLITNSIKSKNNIQFITVNTDFLYIATKNKKFYELCKKSKFNLIDGATVSLLLTLKYNKLFFRTTGTELFHKCCKIANENKLKIALVGSSENVLNSLEQKLIMQFLNIDFMFISPPFEFEYSQEINKKVVEKLKYFQPHFLFVALGCPRQELWIDKNKDEIEARISAGVGSVFDLYSGIKPRAPLLFRKAGFEWLWRLILEPKRLSKRYIKNDVPFFLKQVFKIILKKLSP